MCIIICSMINFFSSIKHSIRQEFNLTENIDIIVIRNGWIVWKHELHCLYFCLNLKFLGWPCMKYITTAIMATWSENFHCGDDFDDAITIFCSHCYSQIACEAVKKITTDEDDYQKCTLHVIVCTTTTYH